MSVHIIDVRSGEKKTEELSDDLKKRTCDLVKKIKNPDTNWDREGWKMLCTPPEDEEIILNEEESKKFVKILGWKEE